MATSMQIEAARRILCVDDEPNVLAALQRHLRKSYEVSTAPGGAAALSLLESEGPFAVVISDMRMPEMNGAQFLQHVRMRFPETVRILLTGYADLESAVAAVNSGHVFRFLTKPCPRELLETSIAEALERYRLRHIELELMERTVKGSVDVLVDLLSLTAPTLFERARQVQGYVGHMAMEMGVAGQWEFEVAARLAYVGCVTVPPEVVEHAFAGSELSESEAQMMDAHPAAGAALLAKIPRLERIAEMVRRQADPTVPYDRTEDPVELGAGMLRAAHAIANEVARKASVHEAVHTIMERSPVRDTFLERMVNFPEQKRRYKREELAARELTTTMVLDQDVRTRSGTLVLTRGRELDETLLQRLRNFSRSGAIEGPLRVMRPIV